MDFTPNLPDFKHQADIRPIMAAADGYALFWEQGTGKSKPTIESMAQKYLDGGIDAMLVVAPMGVHLNWITDELPAHLPPRVAGVMKGLSWRPASAGTKWQDKAFADLLAHQGLAVFCVPVESFITDRMKKMVWRFLSKRRVFYVLDEGITIKSPGAKRTISIVASARHAVKRILLNGTPIANEPWDVYSQMKFVNEDFWRAHELDNLQTFKTHFGIWKKVDADKSATGKAFDLCVGYRRLKELQEILGTASNRVTKEDAGLNIPPKVFTKARFDMSPEQERHYTSIKDEFMTWLDTAQKCDSCGGSGRVCSGGDYTEPCVDCNGSGFGVQGQLMADLAITRMLRFQQVTSGYLPTPMGHELDFHMMRENPRLDRLKTGVLALPHPAIIWYRFQKDGDLIQEMLRANKREVVRYDGTVPEVQRNQAKLDFQQGRAQFFIANPAALSMGVTLTQAKTVVYYNNNFNLVQRLQSEDRAHRIGQDVSVLYVDLVANGTIDEKIVKALREKMDVASQVTGDKWKEWI
jgi:SNF2 family DNA or RNA helicase